MQHEKPRLLDLFSGIGGFSLAFEQEGFQTIGFSETDPYASAVLRKHWPNIRNYGDVRTVPAVECDVITGGFPCQPWSFAGKRRGKDDDRHLWPAMLAIIKRCRPTWVLGENVPGIIGVEFSDLLVGLESEGYSTQPFVVPACAIDAPHRRSPNENRQTKPTPSQLAGKHGMNLATAVLLPTTAQDAKNSTLLVSQRNQDTTGQLNPTWVEWLMGYPAEWTALSASEIQSFRKSRKSSQKQSTNK